MGASWGNYNHLAQGIHATTEYLEYFFENLLLGAKHELKNRYLAVDADIPKCQIGTLNDTLDGTLDCTLEEAAVLNVILANPSVTQAELARQIGKSERTVKRRTVSLQEKRIIKRENGKRNGRWLLMRH